MALTSRLAIMLAAAGAYALKWSVARWACFGLCRAERADQPAAREMLRHPFDASLADRMTGFHMDSDRRLPLAVPQVWADLLQGPQTLAVRERPGSGQMPRGDRLKLY